MFHLFYFQFATKIYLLLTILIVAPQITKLSDAIADHHWCIPFSVAGMEDNLIKKHLLQFKYTLNIFSL